MVCLLSWYPLCFSSMDFCQNGNANPSGRVRPDGASTRSSGSMQAIDTVVTSDDFAWLVHYLSGQIFWWRLHPTPRHKSGSLCWNNCFLCPPLSPHKANLSLTRADWKICTARLEQWIKHGRDTLIINHHDQHRTNSLSSNDLTGANKDLWGLVRRPSAVQDL